MITVTHAKVSAKADSGDATLIQPSDWNDEHVVSGSAGLPLQLPIQDGYYYTSPLIGTVDSGDSFGLDENGDLLVAVPVMFREQKTWTRIGLTCAVGEAGIVGRAGIYSAGADGYPDTLLVDGGELDLSSSGDKEATISQALSANTIYWLAGLFETSVDPEAPATVVTATAGNSTKLGAFMFGSAASAFPIAPMGVKKAQSYGALPASFGAIDEITDTVPYVWLRTGVA